MRKIFKTAISIIICIALFMPGKVLVYAQNEHSTNVEIKLVLSKPFLTINGRRENVDAPFLKGGMIYVPMRTILEALGAEVNWLGNGRINIVYRNVSLELKLGTRSLIVNQVEKELDWIPVTVNKNTMVPIDFVKEYFSVSVSYNQASGEYTIIQTDDGALTDLSFLVDSISKPAAGDSYFGWAMNVPKGSRIINKSFNSKQIYMENENRGLGIQIIVMTEMEETLDSYYYRILGNPGSYLGGHIVDAYIETESVPAFGQFLYINPFGKAVLHRIYSSGDVLINLIITSENETFPERLMDNTYFSDMVNSFRLDYKGNDNGVQDLTGISFGSAKYENYITTDDGKKYFTWEIDVVPKWDILESDSGNVFSTRLGVSNREYMNIEIDKADGIEDLNAYAAEIAEFYNTNFNDKDYLLLGVEETTLGNYKASKITYYIELGKSEYVYEEYYMVSGDLLYTATFRVPAENYPKEKDELYRILCTLKPSTRDTTDLEKNIEKFKYDEAKKRVGKDDGLTVVENKTYLWSMELPGYWTKSNSADSRIQSFLNPKSGTIILFEAVENPSKSNVHQNDFNKFFTISVTQDESIKLVSKGVMKLKGKTVRVYNYRLENAADESFADLNVYVVDGKKYSYCFISSIPDLFASPKNISELRAIWESLTLWDEDSGLQ